jgi:hypothetical protein
MDEVSNRLQRISRELDWYLDFDMHREVTAVLKLEDQLDTQTFKVEFRKLADQYKETPQISDELFDYIDAHITDYINATQEERAEIRKFIKGGLFGSKHIAYALLMYVKNRALRRLKTTKDSIWLTRGLVALSMENYSTSFRDRGYNPSSNPTDANYLLADLHVTALEGEIVPMPIFKEIAKISDTRKYMCETMGMGGIGKLISERRENGKFIGIEW